MKRLKIKLLIIIPLIILLLIITFIVYKQLTKSNTSVANLENKNSILTDKNWQINKPTHEIQTNPLYSGLADYEDEEESIYTLESVLDPNVKYYIDPIIRKDTSVTGSDVCTMIEEDVQNYQPVVIIYDGDVITYPVNLFGSKSILNIGRAIAPVGHSQIVFLKTRNSMLN